MLCQETGIGASEARVGRNTNQSSRMGAKWAFGTETKKRLWRNIWDKHMSIFGWSDFAWKPVPGGEEKDLEFGCAEVLQMITCDSYIGWK